MKSTRNLSVLPYSARTSIIFRVKQHQSLAVPIAQALVAQCDTGPRVLTCTTACTSASEACLQRRRSSDVTAGNTCGTSAQSSTVQPLPLNRLRKTGACIQPDNDSLQSIEAAAPQVERQVEWTLLHHWRRFQQLIMQGLLPGRVCCTLPALRREARSQRRDTRREAHSPGGACQPAGGNGVRSQQRANLLQYVQRCGRPAGLQNMQDEVFRRCGCLDLSTCACKHHSSEWCDVSCRNICLQPCWTLPACFRKDLAAGSARIVGFAPVCPVYT